MIFLIFHIFLQFSFAQTCRYMFLTRLTVVTGSFKSCCGPAISNKLKQEIFFIFSEVFFKKNCFFVAVLDAADNACNTEKQSSALPYVRRSIFVAWFSNGGINARDRVSPLDSCVMNVNNETLTSNLSNTLRTPVTALSAQILDMNGTSFADPAPRLFFSFIFR